MERWTVSKEGAMFPAASEQDDDGDDLLHISTDSMPEMALNLLGRRSSDDFKSAEPDALGGGYVVIEEYDVIEAIGEFIALYLAQVSNRGRRAKTFIIIDFFFRLLFSSHHHSMSPVGPS